MPGIHRDSLAAPEIPGIPPGFLQERMGECNDLITNGIEYIAACQWNQQTFLFRWSIAPASQDVLYVGQFQAHNECEMKI